MKRYLDLIVINLTFLTIGILLFFMVEKRIEILGVVIATGISLSLGIRQSKTENDRIFKELFNEFNTKYDVKFNDSLKSIVKLSEDKKRLNLEDESLIIDYLNFCAEEYLWKTKGRIPDEVWDSWENGMIYYLNNPLINNVFFTESMQKSSYYGLYERMEKMIPNLSIKI